MQHPDTPSTAERPTLLILSFSRIESDARLLKQVALFHEHYDVTTCGFGEAPQGVVRHTRIPNGLSAAKPFSRLLQLRQYRLGYWRQAGVRWVREALRGGQWDAVLANDVEAVPLALALAPRDRVHADLHEYSPRMREDRPGWSRMFRPYLEWMCRRYVARAASCTTVSQGLADEYRRQFGIRAAVVTNAAPYQELAPTPTGRPIRLVHSGAGLPNRGLEVIIDAVAASAGGLTLDLYLMPNHPALLEQLQERAAAVGAVTIHPPVPYSELAATLNRYDVGVFVLPPRTFSYQHALPNKLFDFVQARLAVVVGPTPEMAAIVREHRLGWVTEDFTVESLVRVLDRLEPAAVDEAKAAGHEAAHPLAAEVQMEPWREAIEAIVAASRRH